MAPIAMNPEIRHCHVRLWRLQYKSTTRGEVAHSLNDNVLLLMEQRDSSLLQPLRCHSNFDSLVSTLTLQARFFFRQCAGASEHKSSIRRLDPSSQEAELRWV